MGGERSSKTRMRHAGKICARCGATLPAPQIPGERLCPKCQPPGIHRVYMHFVRQEIWSCRFTEEDLQTPLPCQLTFRSPEKIRAIVDRVGNFADLQDRQSLDYALRTGRGGAWLHLNDDQYRRLKNSKL